MVSPSLTLLRTQSDERLTALTRAGHERAFEAIVERYHRPLLRHGRRLLPEARAEDAVQQALVAAWTALQRGDDVRHLSGWLHRIVHNAALNALRGDRDDCAELREWVEATGTPEDQLERRELLRETLANLAALPERQREALLRVAVDGMPAEEVGSSLGLTEGAVRQLLYRARTALRAAATALTPMPVASWLARAEPLTAQIADAAAGAGSAGLGAVLAKTGVVAVTAGAAAAGPAVLGDTPRRHARLPRDVAARVTPAATHTISLRTAPPAALRRAPAPGDRHPGSSGSGSSESGDDSTRRDSSGPGPSGPGDDSTRRDSSGPGPSGSSGSGSSGSGTSGSGSTELSSSGSSSSGPGPSGSSGSGSSGSTTSGSTTSGSGSSGSSGATTTSGSGSSGPGSTELSSSGPGSSGSGSSGSGSSGSGSSGPGGPAPDATPDPSDSH